MECGQNGTDQENLEGFSRGTEDLSARYNVGI